MNLFLRSLLFKPFLLAFLFTVAAVTTLGDPGSLDPTFGTNGSVFGTISSLNPDAKGIAIQSDGKIVIVGTVFGSDSTQDFGVARFNADGTKDTGFGINGLITIPFDAFANEYAIAVGLQSDGKIIVGGHVQFGAPAWDFGVARLHSDGALDTTFGTNGKAKINIGGDDFLFDMLVQPDDKIVLTGTTRPTPNTDVSVARLTSNGQLDTSFNGGKFNIGIGEGNNDAGTSLALEPDGKIVIAGFTRNPSRSYFLAIRLNTNGLPDFTFSQLGFRQTEIGTQFDQANAVAVQPDGKIVAAGTSNSGSFDEAAFVRYNSNGTLDTSFAGDGKLSIDIRPSNSDVIRSVLIQADGKIVGVGASGGNHILVRLNTNGSLDGNFGTGGKVAKSVAPVNSSAARAVLDGNGKIVAVGDGASQSTVSFTVARFLTTQTSTAPFDFDGDGKTDIAIFRPAPTGGEWWWQRSSDNQVPATPFGLASDVIAPGDFTGDGKLDITVWRPESGFWYILRSEDNSFYGFPFGAQGDVPMTADYDGDGKDDPTVFRDSVGLWFITRSSDNQVETIQFGLPGDVPIAADYDGDGKADVAIKRSGPNGAEWWINRSTQGVIALIFGEPTDRAVPGDYTGDGKADVAFFRPSTGFWFVLRSEDFSFFGFPFGQNGDVPAPGDYDGDGRIDPTVFRPSTNTWFISGSTSGTQIQNFGLPGDRPIPNAFVR